MNSYCDATMAQTVTNNINKNYNSTKSNNFYTDYSAFCLTNTSQFII